jgi:hypothetical protein
VRTADIVSCHPHGVEDAALDGLQAVADIGKARLTITLMA